MSTEIQELPERGEIILATITKITDHGAYVSLDEYDNIQGFLHVSEIAPGWIRSVTRFVKEGEKKVLLVKKVSRNRSDIDLSLKQISKDQKKKKLLEVKKYEKGMTLIKNIQEKAKLSENDIEKLEDSLFSKYDSVYDAFIEIARKGISAISDLKLSKKVLEADYVLVFIASQKIDDNQELYVIAGGADESKKQWFMRIAGEPTGKYVQSDGISGTDYFWDNTMLGQMFPFTTVGYLDVETNSQSLTYVHGYTGIYTKNIKFPSDGDGPLKLVYSSPSFDREKIGQMINVLIYEVNKDYKPN